MRTGDIVVHMTERSTREWMALQLGRLAFVLFYLGVAALVLGVPAALGWLVWRWVGG